MAGYKINHTFNSSVLDVFKTFNGSGPSSVLFEKNRYSVPTAAFLNALYAHGADLDDGNKISAGHIGTHVISAVFALAESLNSTWKDVIPAIIIGYEFFNRIGASAQPCLYNKGFHSTGVIGGIASAAACAKLIGLDKKQMYNAISLAALQANGLIIIDESGQACKPINPANAARIGIESTLLSAQNIDAPQYPLESNKGWFHAFAEEINTDVIFKDLGTKFTINSSYLKLYPTCRHTHACIEAVCEIRNDILTEINQSSTYISKILVYAYPSAIRSAGTIINPRNAQEAKFSIAYAISIAFQKGRFSLVDLEPSHAPIKTKELAEKVKLISDPSMENRELGTRGVKVQVLLANGTIFEKKINTPRGEGNAPLSWIDIENKMIMCAESLLSEVTAKKLVLFCKNIRNTQQFSYPINILSSIEF